MRVLPDAEAASRAAAREVVTRARKAVTARGSFGLALAGGGTPRRLYELLGTEHRDEMPWDRIRVFWGDERCVLPDDPRSNVLMAWRTLLQRVPVPESSVHRIPAELGPRAGAARYDELLAGITGRDAPPVGEDRPAPGLDLAILGIGSDGHTASLFPGQLEPGDSRWSRGVRAPAGADPPERVTLTLRALNAFTDALFLALGPEKRDAVTAVRAAEGRAPAPADPPAAHVRPPGRVLWLVDRAAG